MEKEKDLPPHNEEVAQKYAEHLKFLWEQYNKLMGLGLFGSVGTLAFLLQGVVFNKDTHEVISTLDKPLNINWLYSSIFTAGLAAFCFVICRWCSQILMERQVYGRLEDAYHYFIKTLDNETILPTALEPKIYMKRFTRKGLLKLVGNLNEFAKWSGIVLVIASWLASFIFAWPLIAKLGT